LKSYDSAFKAISLVVINLFTKYALKKIGSGASSGEQGKLTYTCVYLQLRWRQDCRLGSFLSYLRVLRSFLSAIYTLHMIRWSPKEITQHQTLISTICDVSKDALVYVDQILYWFYLRLFARTLTVCFSNAGPRPGTRPWRQLYRAARGSPGICHFSFL